MKPVQGNEQNCLCKNCTFKAEIERPSVKRFIEEGSKIDRLYLGKYLPLREKKLLNKLFKTRAEYDDVQNEILALSPCIIAACNSIDVKEQAGLKQTNNKPIHRDETERSSAVSGLADKGAPELADARERIGECCSCCSCGSILDDNGKTSRPFSLGGHAHKRGSHSSLRDKMKFKRRRRFRAKNISSTPCTCEAKISCIKEELNKEMALLSAKSRAELLLEEDKRRKKGIKRMRKYQRKERSTSRTKITKQIEGRKEMYTSTDEEFDSARKKATESPAAKLKMKKSKEEQQKHAVTTTLPKQERAFRSKELEKSRNQITTEQPAKKYRQKEDSKESESIYMSTEDKKERKVNLDRFKKSMAQNLDYSKFVQNGEMKVESKRIFPDKKPLKVGLKESKSTESANIPTEEEQKPPSKVIDVSKQLESNAHRYSKTRLRQSIEKGALKLKAIRSSMKTNIQDSARKSLDSAKKMRNKIDNRAKHKDLRNQSTKIYKQTKRKDKNVGLDTKRKNRKIRDISSSSSITKSTISTPSLITKTLGKTKMTLSRHRKVDKEIKCRCIEDEFQKIDHKAKNKNIKNASTYKQTKRKNKNTGELTKQRPEDSNLQKIAAKTYLNIQAHEKESIVSSDNKPPGAKPKHINKRIRKISISISGNKKRVEKHKVQKTKHVTKSLKSAKSVSSDTSNQSIWAASTGTISKVKKQRQKMQVKSFPEKSTLSSKGSNLRAQPEFKEKKRGRSLEKKGHRLQRKHSHQSTSTVKSQNSKKYSLRKCMCTLKLGKQNKVKAIKVKPKRVSKGSMTTQENIGDSLRQGLSSKSISLDNAEKSGNRRKRLLPYECEPDICVPDKCDPHNCLKLIKNRERIDMKHYSKQSNTANPIIKSSSTVTSKSTTPSKSKRVQSKVAKYETGVPKRKYSENIAVTTQKVLLSSNTPNRQAIKISSSFSFNIEFYNDRSPSPKSEKPSTKLVSTLGSFKSSGFNKPKLSGSQENIKRNRKLTVTQVDVKQKNTLIGTTIKRCFCNLKLQKAAKKKNKNTNNILKRMSDISTQKSSVSSRNISDGSRIRNERFTRHQNARNNEIIAYHLKQSIDKAHESRQTTGIRSIFSFEQFYKYGLPLETKLCAEGPINDRLDLMSNKFDNKTNEIRMKNQESQTNAASKGMGIKTILKDCLCKLLLHKQSEKIKLTNGKVAMSLAETTITAKRHSLSYERKPRTLGIAYFKCENKTKVGNNFILDPCYNKSAISGIKSDNVNEHSKFNYEVSENNVLEYQTKKKSRYFNQVNQKLVKNISFKLSGIHQLFKSSFYSMNVHVPDKIKRHQLKSDECEPAICKTDTCDPYKCPKRINKRLLKRSSTKTTTAYRTTTGVTVRKLKPYECEPGICIPGKCNPYKCLKRINKRLMKRSSTKTTTANRTTTDVTVRKLKPYECEPGICIPGKCNPYNCLKRINKTQMKRTSTMTTTASRTNIGLTVRKPRRSHQVQSKTHLREKHTRNIYDPTKHEPVPSASQRQGARAESSFSNDIEFFKNRGSAPHYKEHRTKPVKSFSSSMSIGTVTSTKSRTRRNNGIKPNKADRHNKFAKAVTKVVDSGSSVSLRIKRCFCTLKLQKKAKHKAKEPVSTTSQSTIARGKSQKRKHQDRIKRNAIESSSRSRSVVSNVEERRRKRVRFRHGKPKAALSGTEYQSTLTERQVCKIGSSVSFSIEFHKSSIPAADHLQAAAKRLQSQYSRTSRTTNVRRTKLKQKHTKPIRQMDSSVSTLSTSPSKVGHTHKSQAKIAQAQNRGITPMLKRCFCTLKLQKQGKYPPNHKEMKLVAHANKVAAHATKTDYIKHEATLNERGTQRMLKPYECEPGICVPGQCDPYQCQKWINQRLKREFGTSPAHRHAYKSVASAIGTRKKGINIQHGSTRHKSTASVTSTNSRRRKMQHGGPRRSNVSSMSSVSRPSKARRIQHTGPSRSRKSQYTSNEPRRMTPSYIVSDRLSRQAVKISSSFKFNIEFYKDRGGEAAEFRREGPPPSPPRPAPILVSTTSPATLHSGVGTHRTKQHSGVGTLDKKTRSRESQFKKPKHAHAKTGKQFLKRCFCTLALKRKNLPARSSNVSTSTHRQRHVEPTLSEASTVTKRERTREKPTLSEISTATKKEHVRPTDRHVASKTRRLEPYECEPYVCIPGKCNPRECLKRIQRRNMNNFATTTAHDNTRSIGSTKTNISRPIKIQYKGRAKDAHSKMPRPHVRDAHAKSPTLYVKDSHSTSPKRYVRDARSVSSRRKVRHAHSTVIQRKTVSRTLRGPSPQPQRQATKIGSNFSFDIELYRKKTLKTGKQQGYYEEKRHKPVNRTSKRSSASMSPRHKKIQRHKKHRTSSSHIDREKSIQSTMTESPSLKRCFCTLELVDKNQVKQSEAITKRQQNVYVLLQPKGFTLNVPYKSNARKLQPHECEPGICIPGEYDPYECSRRIQGRYVNSKMIGTDHRRSSSSSITPSSTRAMQTQSCSPRCKYQKTQGDQYIVETPRFNPISRPISPTKQVVRIGSNFSFNIEFYKDRLGPNIPEAVGIFPLEDTRQEMRYVKPVPRSFKNRGVHSKIPSYSDRHSQARDASIESRGVGPLLKRCFCTLGLLQKNQAQQVQNQKKKPPVVAKETATVAVGTNRRFSKLKPYECEPGICIPGECDPYECLERMKRRHTRDFGTGSYHTFNRQASTYTSSDAISRGISPSSRNKYRNKSTACPRENIKRTKPVSQYIEGPSVPTSGNAHRQVVRMDSNFSFNIEFFKDRKSPAYAEKTAYKTYEPNHNFIHHETKQKRPCVTRRYGDNVNHRSKASQMTGPKRESIGSGMGPRLKRCFCTLKLQKGLYGRTETVNYMCLPPTKHIKTKITQNIVGCIKDIAPSNRIDRNCIKNNKKELKAENQVIKVCPQPTTCSKNQPSRIIKVIKNLFIALKHKSSESKPKVQRKSDKVARGANEKEKKKLRKDSHLVKTNCFTDNKNKNKTFSKLGDDVQKSCMCNDKQRWSNIKHNAGCNEMKTIFPYVPTKYNNNVSKTFIIQNNELKSGLRSSGQYCSHCDKTKRTIDNKYNNNSPFKAVNKSNKILFRNHSSNLESKESKIINFKQIKRNLLQLFKRDRKELSVNINVETNTDINLRKDKIYKGIKKQNDEMLKTSKSERRPTSSKCNFTPKKSNSLKITKISEKKRRGKNGLMFVEQGNKKYSRYQSGDTEQNVVKTNKKDGIRWSVVPCKHQNPAYVNFQPSHNQDKYNLITRSPPYMNDKFVQFAFVPPKREFKKKGNRTVNDECFEDSCVAKDVICPSANGNKKRMARRPIKQEINRTANADQCVEDFYVAHYVDCPCANRNKKRKARIQDQEIQDLHRINQSTRMARRPIKQGINRTANADQCVEDFCVAHDVDCPCAKRNKKRKARIQDQEIQDFHRINQSTRKGKSKTCCLRLRFWKKQHDNNINKTDKEEKQVDLYPKNIYEKQAAVCMTSKPCECCHGKKKKKPFNEICVPACKTKETKKEKIQKEKCDRTPLFEMKLEANSMDILNKEHVSDMVGRLSPKRMGKEVLKLHGKSCQCCICKTARKNGVDVSDLTLELPKVKRKLNLKPCICGSEECARESSRRARKKALSLLPKRKPCVCGTKICADEMLKLELKQKNIPKSRIRQLKSKKYFIKSQAQKKRNELDTLARQKRYKEEDELRRKRQIIADKYMQGQVKKFANASDQVLLVESVLDVAKLGVTTLTTIMRCICRTIFDPRNAYRKISTVGQDPTRVCINLKDAVSQLGVKATAQRVGYRVRAMRTVDVFVRKLEDKPIFNFLIHTFDKDPKKRMMRNKQRRRRREPIAFECSLFMASLRKRPHLWLYYFCPWFYPHCIGMLQILRSFADVMLFILAVFVWSPCILAMEICRTLMCCTLCTG